MGKYFFILSLLLSASAYGQLPTYKDTVISGWVVRIRPGTTGEAIWFSPGAGQVGNGTLGNDTAFISQYGLEFWIKNGRSVSTTLGNGTHIPTIITVIQPGNSGFTPAIQLRAVVDGVLASRFAPSKGRNNMSWWGFSAGGWLGCMFNATTFSSTSDTTCYNYFTTVVDLQGVVSNDNSGSTIGYPQRFGHRAKVKKFRYLGIEGTFDESRDIWGRRDNILDSVPSAEAYGIWTVDGGGGHCCWNDYMDPNQNNFTISNGLFIASHDGATSNFLPAGENLLQFSLRGGDTTLGNVPPLCSAGNPGQVQLPATTTTLVGTASGVNGATITSTAWSVLVNPTGASASITSPSSLTTGVTGMTTWGNYVFRLIATDNNGLKDTATVRVNVLPICNANPGRRLTIGLTQTTPTTEVYRPSSAQSSSGALGGDTIIMPRNGGKVYDVAWLGELSGDACRDIVVMWDSAALIRGRITFGPHVQYVTFDLSNVRIVGGGGDAIDGFLFNHITIKNFLIDSAAGGAGMLLKTIADTSNPETIYPNSKMTKLTVINGTVQNTHDNAFYIGTTNTSGLDNGQPPGVPPRMDSVRVSHVTLKNIGETGISVSAAGNAMSIDSNSMTNVGIRHSGTPFSVGIEMGAATTGNIYGNTIKNVWANAIEVFGHSTINVHDNVIDSAGINTGSDGHEATFANDVVDLMESHPSLQWNVYNNTFSHAYPGSATIHAYNDNSNMFAANVHDNTICIPTGANGGGLAFYITGSPSPVVSNNSLTTTCATVSANAGSNQTITTPVNSVTLNGSASTGATSYLWTKISGPGSFTITTPTTVSTTVTGLIAGTYVFQLSINSGASTSNVSITVNPSVIIGAQRVPFFSGHKIVAH